jgi:hypothetical protein
MNTAVVGFQYARGFLLQNLLSLANNATLVSEYDERWARIKRKTESGGIWTALEVDKEGE